MPPQFLPDHPQIAVFGRIPRPGAGKSRLARGVGTARAAELARAFLLDVIDTCRQVAPGGTWFYVAPEEERDAASTCAAAQDLVGDGVHVELQQGTHLGARMNHALAALCPLGPSLLVGGDVPDLPPPFARRALAWLAKSAGAPRLVLGPAADGGFVLIGADRAPGAMLAEPTEWGSGAVCARTMQLARTARPPWEVLALEPWWDVDEAEDLAALAGRLSMRAAADGDAAAGWPRRTAALLGYRPPPDPGAGSIGG